jgi:glycosyltransferase involved in cell wall biosynthesis
MIKPRVLHIASWYPSAKEPRLGNFVQRHLEALALKTAVTVITATIGKPGVTVKNKSGVSVVEVAYQKKWPLISKLKAYRRGFNYLAKQGCSFNLIHVHVAYPAAIAAQYLGLPYIISEHFSGYQKNRQHNWGRLKKRLILRALNRAASILPVSKALGQGLRDFGYKGPLQPVSNVVQTNVFQIPNESPKENSVKRFLHISTLANEVKNVTGLLDGFALLQAKSEAFTLAIGGDGDLQWLGKEIEKRQLKNVEILNAMTPHEVAWQMQQADCFVLFSHIESQGIVLLESLSCGTPVIAPNVGGVPEIVNDQNGLLVNPNDAKSLYRALIKIINGYNFNSQKAARVIANKYGPEAIAEQFFTIYASALRSNA